MDKYNTDLALKAQAKLCEERGIPNFAPGLDGKCYRCNRDIYRPVDHGNGRITGITVETASKTLVTGCPHCNYSFVD